jgi:hypothetical protein
MTEAAATTPAKSRFSLTAFRTRPLFDQDDRVATPVRRAFDDTDLAAPDDAQDPAPAHAAAVDPAPVAPFAPTPIAAVVPEPVADPEPDAAVAPEPVVDAVPLVAERLKAAPAWIAKLTVTAAIPSASPVSAGKWKRRLMNTVTFGGFEKAVKESHEFGKTVGYITAWELAKIDIQALRENNARTIKEVRTFERDKRDAMIAAAVATAIDKTEKRMNAEHGNTKRDLNIVGGALSRLLAGKNVAALDGANSNSRMTGRGRLLASFAAIASVLVGIAAAYAKDTVADVVYGAVPQAPVHCTNKASTTPDGSTMKIAGNCDVSAVHFRADKAGTKPLWNIQQIDDYNFVVTAKRGTRLSSTPGPLNAG